MPLSEFTIPAITDQYLHRLDMVQLADLLVHKTNGLLVASRTHLMGTEIGIELKEDVQKIQQEIKSRAKKTGN